MSAPAPGDEESSLEQKKSGKLSMKIVKKLCASASSKKKCGKGDTREHCTFGKKKGCTPK